jgi:hypothetical protein
MNVANILTAFGLTVVLAVAGTGRALCEETTGPTSTATKRPHSYQECVGAGGRVQESNPPRCVLDSGLVFVAPPKEQESACKDLCGDGTCQEMVCMAVGCPCAESPATCPADCH